MYWLVCLYSIHKLNMTPNIQSKCKGKCLFAYFIIIIVIKVFSSFCILLNCKFRCLFSVVHKGGLVIVSTIFSWLRQTICQVVSSKLFNYCNNHFFMAKYIVYQCRVLECETVFIWKTNQHCSGRKGVCKSNSIWLILYIFWKANKNSHKKCQWPNNFAHD